MPTSGATSPPTPLPWWTAPATVPQVEQRWNQEQLRTFLDACRSSRYPYNALFPFLLATGLRRGEALALRWADVDLETGTVRIHRARGFAGPGQVVEGPTKTGKERVLALDGFTVRLLRDHHKRQTQRRASEYVFADGRGRPLYPDNPTGVFKALVRRAGLPDAHLHSLRHLSAIYDLKAGTPVPVVSARLGHSSIAMTLDVYSRHVPNDWQREAAEARGRLIFGG